MSKRFSHRMVLGGAPALVSTGIAAVVPLAGILFLRTDQYATWTLVSTLSTMFLIFDFGAPALATKLAAENRASASALMRVVGLTAAPPLALTIVAMLIWPGYANVSGLTAFDNGTVLSVIAAVGIGSSLRSTANVYAAVSLGREKYGVRAFILLAASIAMALATLMSLAAGLQLHSLGIGVFAGGLFGVLIALLLERSLDPGESDQETRGLVRLFLSSKGAATLLGLTITQLDRWAIGLAGDPALLAQYDVFTRLIQIPKIALLALFVGLVSESVRRSPTQLVSLWKRSTLLVLAGFTLPQVVLIPVAVWLASTETPLTTQLLLLAFGVFVAQLALSATIPVTLMLAGIGAPQRELYYLVPLCAGVLVAYALGTAVSSAVLIVVGWLGMVTLSSIVYALSGPRLLRKKQ